jgi:hypothetical protein
MAGVSMENDEEYGFLRYIFVLKKAWTMSTTGGLRWGAGLL